MESVREPESRATCSGGRLATLLTVSGIAALMIGRSVVLGSIKEDEPRAAGRGLAVFGAVGLILILLGRVVRRG
jgi:hypothetical protein